MAVATAMVQRLASPMARALGRGVEGVFTPPPQVPKAQILKTLFDSGSVDGQTLPDELRTGTPRDSWPGVAFLGNGVNQYVGRQSGVGVPSAFPFTLSGWFYPTASAFQVVCGLCDDATFDEYFSIVYDGAAQKVAAVRRTSAGQVDTYINTILPLNTLHHAAICFLSDTSFKWSLNGSMWTTVTGLASRPIPTMNTYLSGNVRISGGLSYLFTGRLFDHRFWNREIDQVELNAVYAFESVTSGLVCHWPLNKPNCVRQDDVSGNGNHGTIANYALTCHHYGSDVPRQPMNTVGYSSSAAANVLTAPNDFTNAAWTKRGTCTVTANQEYHPTAGTLTADKIEGLNTASNDLYNANHNGGVTGLAAGLRRRSFWIKRISTSGELFMSDPNDGKGDLLINLATIGAGWVLVDSAAPSLPTGVTRRNEEASYSALQGGMLWRGVSGGPLSFYLAEARVSQGYLPQINAANPAQDVDGNVPEFTGEAPVKPRVKASNCLKLATNQVIPLTAGLWNTDGTQAMEIEWVGRRNNTSYGSVASNRLSSGNNNGWEVGYSGIAAGDLFFCICNVASSTNALWVYYPLMDDLQHRCKWTYDGSGTAAGVALYIDGIRTGFTIYSNNLSGAVNASTAISAIGARNGNAGYLNGTIADLRVMIGSTTWRARGSEGGGSTGCYVNDQFFGITNAGSNWTETQNIVNVNFRDGFRLEGSIRVPPGTTPLVAANGQPITNPPGPWFNKPESVIDFTGGQSLNPIFNGQVITDIDDYVAGRSVATLYKVSTGVFENQYLLSAP